MRPKSIIWGQMGGNGCGKRMEKGLSDRLVEGTLKFWERLFDGVELHAVGWHGLCMQD
jgi:hypothetical protein